MRILISVGYATDWSLPADVHGDHEIRIERRGSDWGKTGLRKQLFHVRDAIRVLRRARGLDALVLCTAGIEAFIAAKLRRWICPSTTLVLFDPLIPRPGRLERMVRGWLRSIDAALVIRRGDAQTLHRRFAVPLTNTRFVPFPADARIPLSDRDDGYIYAAGAAHRDWPTLIEALRSVSGRAIISTNDAIELPADLEGRVCHLPAQSPADGRRLMAGARLYVLALHDTELPAGPVVLLDAMSMGKAVVTSRVNGTRDYIDDGKTGTLVPPQEPGALADAINHLMDSHTERRALGLEARAAASRRFTLTQSISSMIHTCEELHACEPLDGAAPIASATPTAGRIER